MITTPEFFVKNEESDKKTKTEIFKKIENEVIALIKDSEDTRQVWGSTYELFVQQELSLKEEESQTKELENLYQDIIRQIYDKARFFLGKNKDLPLGRPDGLKFVFQDGQIIIEIVEMKSSYYAYEHGRDSEQPKRTLNTIVSIINVVNMLSEGRGNAWILDSLPEVPRDKDNLKQWKEEINKLRTQIQKFRSTLPADIPKINLSSNLKYRIITPSDEDMTGFKQDTITSNDGQHNIMVTNEKSLLSKNELHKIINHYLEQKSK